MVDHRLAPSCDILETTPLRGVFSTVPLERTEQASLLPFFSRYCTFLPYLVPLTLSVQLAGVDDETIAHEYALTRVGREPAREMIMARLSQEPLFASNNEAALNMFTCRYDGNTVL